MDYESTLVFKVVMCKPTKRNIKSRPLLKRMQCQVKLTIILRNTIHVFERNGRFKRCFDYLTKPLKR